MPEQLMSPDQAERTIWSFYWQLDNSRDRRAAAPVGPQPSVEQAHAQQEEQSFMGGLLESVQKQIDRFYTTRKRQEYLDAEADRAKAEIKARNDALPGQLDPKTGLPAKASDLATGRGVVSGIDLCLEVILPPEGVAGTATARLEPLPLGEKSETWGDKDEHWKVLGYIPKAEWDDDEVATVKANGLMIKKGVHKLADHGYFILRPLNERDAETNDLVWEDRAGFTLGYRLTYKGYQRMKEYCDQDPELKRSIHLLTYAGKDLRDQAPEWARREYQDANE